jgi:hypothetical protein
VPTGIGDEGDEGQTVATRKDQLDAFNFARRRMVANLVVPTATGSDEGAPRPVKTFTTSIILSAIAVAAVAVVGVFKPAAPSGWQNGLAVDESTGAAYIYTKANNQLHSVYNITSARLILGGNFAKYDVPDSTINGSGLTIGAPVGILGAPEDVPAASDMTLTQWSMCQNAANPADQSVAGGTTYLEIGYGPSAQTETWGSNSGYGLIVHDSQSDVYLIDGDYKYEIGNYAQSPSTVNDLLTGMNRDTTWSGGDGFWVSDAWLSVFTQGSPIAFPELADGFGDPVTAAHQVGGHVGDYGQNASGVGGSVQTADGLLELSPFAYFLYAGNPALAQGSYRAASIPETSLTAPVIDSANPGTAPSPSALFAAGTYGTNWPSIDPSFNNSTDTTQADTENICVGYDGKYENGNTVPQLSTWTSATLPYGTPGTQFGGLSQSGADNEAGVVLVRPGYGLVAQRLSGGYGSGGQEFLIEDSDYRYALVTVQTAATSTAQAGTESAKDLLGYQYVADEQVPQAWVNLIQGGASLDPTAAGMTPGNGQ